MNLFTKARSLDNTLNDISFITIFWWIKTSLSAYDHEDRHSSFPVPFHTSFTPLVASTAHEKQDTAVRLLINPPKTTISDTVHIWAIPDYTLHLMHFTYLRWRHHCLIFALLLQPLFSIFALHYSSYGIFTTFHLLFRFYLTTALRCSALTAFFFIHFALHFSDYNVTYDFPFRM